jgi:hypothetical protein
MLDQQVPRIRRNSHAASTKLYSTYAHAKTVGGIRSAHVWQELTVELVPRSQVWFGGGSYC